MSHRCRGRDPPVHRGSPGIDPIQTYRPHQGGSRYTSMMRVRPEWKNQRGVVAVITLIHLNDPRLITHYVNQFPVAVRAADILL